MSETADYKLLNNRATAAVSRHADTIRLSQLLAHISPLISPNLPAEQRHSAAKLTPGPVIRCICAKNNALLVIVLNVDESCSMAKEMVLFDSWTPVNAAHIVRKGAASHV